MFPRRWWDTKETENAARMEMMGMWWIQIASMVFMHTSGKRQQLLFSFSCVINAFSF